MVSGDITFEAVNITTVLWTDHGFEPEPEDSIVTVGKELKEIFARGNVVGELSKMLEVSEADVEYHSPRFEPTKGNEHIKLTKFNNIKMNGVTVDELILRVHVCNRVEGSRAKITVSANLDFREHPHDTMTTVNLMNSIFKKEEDICRFIHEKIPESFSLGGVKYISNIASVESNDPAIDVIIESVLASGKTEFEFSPHCADAGRVLDKKKILDAYHVLLPTGTLISDAEPITPEAIRDAIDRVEAKQSKMIIYQSNKKIPTKTLNYEIGRDHRVITNLTEQYSALAVTNRLVNDYLSLT